MSIETVNLRKSFVDADKRLSVIDGLTFSFPEKSSVAVVGRSGVGKSTLLHLLAGLEPADSGSIIIGADDICKFNAEQMSEFRGNRIGVIFQFHHLLGDFNALENVAMPLFIKGIDDETALGKAEETLKRVGLGHRLTHTPGELSGGEQQRVAIARALVHKPSIIVADEPTGNLDVKTAEEIGELLKEIQQQQRLFLLLVTHSNELARSLDFVYEMLPGGKLVPADKKSASLSAQS